MFLFERTIRLKETDATGVLYFSELLGMAQEAFEEYLLQRGFSLEKMRQESPFLLPIVHAEADFSVPLRVGDRLQIALSIGEIGASSFSLITLFSLKGQEAGKARIVHVAISKETQQSIPLPELVLKFLKDFLTTELTENTEAASLR